MTGALLLIAALAVDCDFSVTDDRGGAYSIDIERRSPLSHGHGWVEGGRYKIAVDGNRHFIAAPNVGDFRLEADLELELFRLNFTLGYTVFFRWDRAKGTGHRLDVLWDAKRVLHFMLDGADVLTRQDADPLPLKDLRLVLEVSGGRGRVETAGAAADFALPTTAADKGEVGFDLTVNESEKLWFSRLRLTSPEEPKAEPAGTWRFTLPRSQGFVESPVFDVAAWTYPDGTARIDLQLDGTVQGLKPRQPSGGGEWSMMNERLTSPYVALAADGFARKLYLWNGMRRLFDPTMSAKRGRKLGPWPMRRSVFLRGGLPKDLVLSAGYEQAMANPWRFAGDGPFEQVQFHDGRVVYEGEAVRPGRVAVRVRSSPEKRIVSKIPAGIPARERALRFAREQHCFCEGEPVEFTVETVWREREFAEGEVAVTPRLETVFGKATPIACEKTGGRTEPLAAGLVRRTETFRLARNPGVGVWHFQTGLDAGVANRRDVRTVFEVLPDDPNGPCPPLASGLPTLVSVPNEIRFLEENAFDPWGEFGGIGHYYAIDVRYPSVAERLKVWELESLYRRKWWAMLFSRNTDDIDLDSPRNRELLKHADYLWHLIPGKHREGRFDFCRADFYKDLQFSILKDFLATHPGPRTLDAKTLAVREKENRGLTREELKDLFDTCWDDFKAFAAKRVAAIAKAYDEDLLRRNPEIARASYGPMPVYTAVYKTPYTLETDSHPLDGDPRLVGNGSFWIFEDYHYSCDYPILRPAFFVAAYKMLHPESRRIFPEIYYQGWGRCADGAVYQAHPDKSIDLAPTHQRRVVYRYAYATPYFADGRFAFWTDYGFHARNPEREAMDEFVYAWGKLRENRPAKPLRAPFAMVDPDAFRRFGDFFDSDGTYAMRGPGFENDVRTEIGNIAEEDVAWAFERCCLEGRATPVTSRLAELDRIDPADCEFVILPPLAKSTSPDVIAAIRRAHERGLALLGFESVTGLEDLFAAGPDEFLTKETKWGRTALVNCRPTLVGRMDFKTRYSRGRPTLSTRMQKGLAGLFAFLAPQPGTATERGTITAVRTEKGDIVAIVEDESPLYGDATAYPAVFRFSVAAPGVGAAEIDADAPFNVVSREADRIVIRTETAKDTALFFRLRAPVR